MYFPSYRPRRLRRSKGIRELVAETTLSIDDFIYPMFVMPGKNKRVEVKSMPGIYKQSIDNLIKEIREVKK
ncbi:MAG: porphobilinogen synthase, partial [Thermodesulfobacteriota bacterium]